MKGPRFLVRRATQITQVGAISSGQNPTTALIGKKAGNKIKPGDRVQVRNPNGTVSQEFAFTG